ncbi:signal peptidase I [Brachybacterium endophyticum]|uniref:Signal peptidase I n=1 Tax=Brachybacterium endophyticum TaxID=2182385 RepID=A0A2U2RLH6_9MICO|nr:signal peptidase I [Brachybacterium endophyticum]PWH06720.1 signal peptidase I [Brachybacterium endophyticum]
MPTDPASERTGASPSRRRPLLVAAAVVVVLLIAAFGVRSFVVAPFRVPSSSMAPTLRTGDVVLADRSTRGTAERGEIVVFDGSGYFPKQGAISSYWVKRVVAVGGDHISCCSKGRLILNGKPLEEPYLPRGTDTSTVRFDLEVPEGRMFVLGDSRTDSTDSRFLLGQPGGGMIPVDRVVGEASRIVWPRDRAGTPGQLGSAR